MSVAVCRRMTKHALVLAVVLGCGHAKQPGMPGNVTDGGGDTADADPGYQFPDIPPTPSAKPLTGIATFETIGLYWSAEQGATAHAGLLRYRKAGTVTWLHAHDLWFDDRNLAAAPARSKEYRGSIVGLEPGTTYEIEAFVDGIGEIASTMVTTWSETFPIAQTIEVDNLTNDTLAIATSGAPDGYVVYTAKAGGTTIDGAKTATYNVTIHASYVIVRGLTLINANSSSIFVDIGSHDVVIENNDISGWGQNASDGWGIDMESGVLTAYDGDTTSIQRLVIQRNKIHDPFSNSNNWNEPRPFYNNDPHPAGPQGISLFDTGGNHVIRYNEIAGNATHHFNDGFGGAHNFSWDGSPAFDSDIYGNQISYAWDDCIESEGANQNTRIWGNYLDHCYVMLAASSTSIGPLYYFRNIFYRNEKAPGIPRGATFKLQSNTTTNATWGGRVYILHNTAYRSADGAGIQNGLSCSNAAITNTVTRNNIIQASEQFIWDALQETTNDFDHDLYRGTIFAMAGAEATGVAGDPIYDTSGATGMYALDPSSPGYGAAVAIPNFNSGSTADLGAQDHTAPPLVFGVH